MGDTMRAVDVKGGAGEVGDLFINPDTPKPVPGEGQGLVKVKAFGINRMDILQRRGVYPVPPNAPKTMGVEFSGTIESLGPGEHDWTVGDAVFGLVTGGAYAEYVLASSKTLLAKPDSLSFEQCAAIPENWLTATQALELILGFTKGKSILWHAGASGVSIAGIQLSHAAGGAEVYATAGSDEKCGFLKTRLGVTAAFNYKTQDWAKEIKEKTGGKGVDFIVDYIGADYFQKNLDVAALDSRIVFLGFMSGSKVPDANLSAILYKRIRIEGSTLRSRDEDYHKRLRDRLQEHLAQFETGALAVVLDTVLPWEKIQEAHQHMQDAKNSGKIVCTIA